MKKALTIIVVLFLILQFFRIEKTNPAENQGMDFLTIKNTPQNISKQIKASCYDCHSNETVYPWYSNIQPVAWFLKSHIDEGRNKLNFSTFSTYEPQKQAHKLEECIEMIEKNEMPLESYTLMHPNAKLTPEAKKNLLEYFKKIQKDTESNTSL